MNTNNLIDKELEDKVLDLYINQGKGQSAVMKATNITLTQLKNILTKNNYHLRNRHEAIVAANKGRNKMEKHDYFSKQSSNMAWLMGFIAADGSIEKNRNVIKISLSSIDKEILEKIRKEIGLQTEVKDYITNEGYAVSKIQWSSEQHKKDLAFFGIIPQKTFLLKPPYNLQRKFWIDYIRGFFDGDGSIYLKPNEYNRLCWEIGSATKEILEFIVNFFYEEYGIPKVNIHETKRKEKFYLLIYSTNATKEIYKHFYKNSEVLALSRKKNKYTEIINTKNSNN